MFRFIVSFVFGLAPVFVLADNTDQVTVPVADPVVEVLIEQLGLRESATASRDLPGWSPPQNQRLDGCPGGFRRG